MKIKSNVSKSEMWSERKKSSFGETGWSNKFPGLIPLKAKGIYITDVDENKYLDFTAQRVNVGHNHPRLLKAVKKQIFEGGLQIGDLPKIILAEKLKEIAPREFTKSIVVFTRGGTSAIDKAILTIRSYSRKRILFAFQGSYHGSSLGALSITLDWSHYRKGLSPMTPDVVYAPFAYCYRCVFKQKHPDCGFLCVDYIQYVLDTVANPEDIAAIFLEPIQVHGGVIIPPDGYFKRIREICDENQILLVDDEIVTGFGRTGKFFGIEHSGVIPDIMVLGKPMANGLDLGAIMGIKEVMESRPVSRGNPVSCVAASENINVIIEEKLEKNASKMGDYMIKRLIEMKEEHEIIGDIRGKGLLIGIELVQNYRLKKPATKETKEIVREAYREGLLMLIGGTYRQVLRLTPPLNITIEGIDEALQILEKTLRKLSF